MWRGMDSSMGREGRAERMRMCWEERKRRGSMDSGYWWDLCVQ
jgi:hypothetical protein